MVTKWFVDDGYGFVDVQGKEVFCHADKIVGQAWLKEKRKVWLKVTEDRAKGPDFWRGVKVWEETRWKEEEARRRAKEAVEVTARAAKVAHQAAHLYRRAAGRRRHTGRHTRWPREEAGRCLG